MALNYSFILILGTLAMGLALYLMDNSPKKKLSTKKIEKIFWEASNTVLGVYAFFYALFFIGFKAVGINVPFPQDNTALTIVLLYGGFVLTYPILLKYIPEKLTFIKSKK